MESIDRMLAGCGGLFFEGTQLTLDTCSAYFDLRRGRVPAEQTIKLYVHHVRKTFWTVPTFSLAFLIRLCVWGWWGGGGSWG